MHANFEFTCLGVKTAYVQIKKEQEIFESHQPPVKRIFAFLMVDSEISFITFKSVCCGGHFFEVQILPALKVLYKQMH